MRYSEIALTVLAAKELGLIRSNAQFAAEFSQRSVFEQAASRQEKILEVSDALRHRFLECGDDEGFICSFDESFPKINSRAKNSDRPYLLFYKGDITLLKDLNRNVAVIGLVDPDSSIEQREREITGRLLEHNLVIVSGLAKGCDSIAHRACVERGGKTIAVLPSQIHNITPAANRELADEIVHAGGLLLSEYYREAQSRNQAIGRFIERDRLQAMFSKAVILIASYRKNEGDSGSRHAMEAAGRYGLARYVMFNQKTDMGQRQFGLNEDYVMQRTAKVLSRDGIEEIAGLQNPELLSDSEQNTPVQLELF